jgi:chemotaxis protein MotB
MRRKRHEDHVNHEAWAIPYGDLLTLLLAFFVVMYAISSVNEGKYRVLSDALAVAFGGQPKSMTPIQIGSLERGPGASQQRIALLQNPQTEQSIGGTMRELKNPAVVPAPKPSSLPDQQVNPSGATGYAEQQLREIGDRMEKAMGDLIDKKLVSIKRGKTSLEVQIRTDILFPSGSADIAQSAVPILDRVASILKSFPNPLRIEGHTDNVPIHTLAFPSNWELSAARAATVVHLFMDQGVAPARMQVAGFADNRPVASNDSSDGRNQNRRVSLVVLMADGTPLPGDIANPPAAAGPAATGGDENAAAVTPAPPPAAPESAPKKPQRPVKGEKP